MEMRMARERIFHYGLESYSRKRTALSIGFLAFCGNAPWNAKRTDGTTDSEKAKRSRQRAVDKVDNDGDNALSRRSAIFVCHCLWHATKMLTLLHTFMIRDLWFMRTTQLSESMSPPFHEIIAEWSIVLRTLFISSIVHHVSTRQMVYCNCHHQLSGTKTNQSCFAFLCPFPCTLLRILLHHTPLEFVAVWHPVLTRHCRFDPKSGIYMVQRALCRRHAADACIQSLAVSIRGISSKVHDTLSHQPLPWRRGQCGDTHLDRIGELALYRQHHSSYNEWPLCTLFVYNTVLNTSMNRK